MFSKSSSFGVNESSWWLYLTLFRLEDHIVQKELDGWNVVSWRGAWSSVDQSDLGDSSKHT